MTTKFACCLDYLCKEATGLERASGLRRYGQLLTGSRARALEERASGVNQAGHRAWRALNRAEPTIGQGSLWDRMQANAAAAQRAGRMAQTENAAVNKTRALTAAGAGTLGAGALGLATLQGSPKTESMPSSESNGETLPPEKSPFWEGAKVVGSGLAGLGLGQLAGAAAGKGIEYVTKRQGGDPVEMARKIGPIVGTAAGLLYPMWRAREAQEVTNAVESARDHNERRLSGQ